MRTWAEVDRILASGDVGGRLTRSDLPTPALMLDLDAFERNLAKMAAHAKASGRALRPHAKTHKCPQIAKACIRAGAAGACTAKLSEAEVFARHGVHGLLVTTAVIGRHKIERAVALASAQPGAIFCVDDARNLRDLDAAAASAKISLNLAIDLFVGRRTGIEPGPPALELAQMIDGLAHVTLAGIQAYAGFASHIVGFEERRKASTEAMGRAVETRRSFERSGIPCPLLTGASTGTYNIDSEIDGVTELQPGSFLFMDVDYGRIGGQDGPAYRDFQHALSVLTTVVSRPDALTAIVDGGIKAFATDRAFGPELRGITGTTFTWGGDEHGRIHLANASAAIEVGDRLEFIIPHCDPTVNLYDRMYCLRGERVETVWPIAARGMSQ